MTNPQNLAENARSDRPCCQARPACLHRAHTKLAGTMVNCKASELLIQALCVPFSQRCLRCPPSGAHHQRSVQVRVMPASALAVAAAGWRATKCAYGTVRGDGMAQRYSTPPSSPGAAHNGLCIPTKPPRLPKFTCGACCRWCTQHCRCPDGPRRRC